MSQFPYIARLIEEPQSQYARSHMTVGNLYLVHGQAGSCVTVDTDMPMDHTMVHGGSLTPLTKDELRTLQ